MASGVHGSRRVGCCARCGQVWSNAPAASKPAFGGRGRGVHALICGGSASTRASAKGHEPIEERACVASGLEVAHELVDKPLPFDR
eukprot:6210158-Pleurochrysis_carterae.AAC.1